MTRHAWFAATTCSLMWAPSAHVVIADTPEIAASSATWSWGPAVPRAKSAFATASDGEVVITVGGTWWETGADSKPIKRFTTEVYAWGPDGDRWSRLPDFPTPIDYALAVCLRGRLIVAGGTGADNKPLRETWELDLQDPAAQWRPADDLPWHATRLRGGVIGDRVYALVDPAPAAPGADASGNRPQVILVREPDGAWAIAAEVPDADVRYRSAVACGDELLLFGGATTTPTGLALREDTWAWNPDQKTWRRLTPLPLPMRDLSVARLDAHSILIAGGVETAINALATPAPPKPTDRTILSNRAWRYHVTDDRYEPVPSLPLAVADHGLVVCGSRLIAVAGEDSVYRTRTDLVQQIDIGGLNPR